jgi:hypothetical protein
VKGEATGKFKVASSALSEEDKETRLRRLFIRTSGRIDRTARTICAD